MGEAFAREAIRNGNITKDGWIYNVAKAPKGHCIDKCVFRTINTGCNGPQWAKTICNTGGHYFPSKVPIRQETEL